MDFHAWELFSVYAAGSAFVLLALFVLYAPQKTHAIDSKLGKRFEVFATPRWSQFFRPLTFFGSAPGILLAALGLGLFFSAELSVLERLAIALFGSAATAYILKLVAARIRPAVHPWLAPLTDYSFPSGHATAATALYGFGAIMLYYAAQTDLATILALLIPGALILQIGFSRLALAAHFPLDVIGGYLLGAFWIALAFLIPL